MTTKQLLEIIEKSIKADLDDGELSMADMGLVRGIILEILVTVEAEIDPNRLANPPRPAPPALRKDKV